MKPYLLTCCSKSICKICKVCKFDLTQSTECIFCKSSKFKIEPNIQAYICIKSILALKNFEPLKSDEDTVNKIDVWKELNYIYHEKMKLKKLDVKVKDEDKSKFLMSWLKQLLTGTYCVVKLSNIRESADKTKITLPKQILDTEAFSETTGNNQYLIITEDLQRLQGLVHLGKEIKSESKRDRNRDRDKDREKDKDSDKDSKQFKCTWKVICDLTQDLEVTEDIEKLTPKQAIDLILKMLRDEVEQEKQLSESENPEENFYQYAKKSLISDNSWLPSSVPHSDSLRSMRSDEKGANDDTTDAALAASQFSGAEPSTQKKGSNAEEADFYDNIPTSSGLANPALIPKDSRDSKAGKSGKSPSLIKTHNAC